MCVCICGERRHEGRVGSVKTSGFRGIEAREKRRRRRGSSVFGIFVCVHGGRACVREAVTAAKKQR